MTAKVIHRPMKLKQIDPASLPEYHDDKDWFFQQKVDGIRAQLVIEQDRVWVRSSLGEVLKSSAATPIADKVREFIEGMPVGIRRQLSNVTFDGEIVDGAWWFFDLVLAGNPELSYASRYNLLENIFDVWTLHPLMKLLPTAYTAEDKKVLTAAIRANAGEGVVIKHREGTYRPNVRSHEVLKAKFVQTADVIVLERNVGASVKVGSAGAATGKLNATVGCYDSDGNIVVLGNCSMIGKPDAQVGDVIEIKFLYLGAGNRLVQPSCLKIRDDKRPADCTMGQFRMMTRTVVTSI